MNTAFRIIWSHTRQAFVVVDELTSARGKRSASRLLLAGAGAGLLAAAGPAMAAPACSGTTPTLSGVALTSTCSIEGGASLTVNGDSSITTAGTNAINTATTPGYWSTISNGGSVTSENGTAIAIGAGSGTSITNQTGGKISGYDNAIVLSGGASSLNLGAIANFGRITAVTSTGSAVNILKGAALYSMLNRGTISGGTGVNLNGGTIRTDLYNSGAITGDRFGLQVTNGSKVEGVIENTGLIGGKTAGINLALDDEGGSGTGSVGWLINSGTIKSDTGIAVQVDKGEITGGISNDASGIITGAIGIASQGTRINGPILNKGAIQGTAVGISVDGGSVKAIDNNSGGRVAGQAYGILLANGATIDTITNSGIIGGALNSIKVDSDTSGSLAKLVIDGNDTARFMGAVDAKDTDVLLRKDATYTLTGGEAFTIKSFSNDGTLRVASSAGVTANFNGDYSQTGNGTLKIGVADDNHFGKLTVSGTATLQSNANIVVDVSNASTKFNVSHMDKVFSAGTLVSDGTFAVSDNSLLFDFGAIKNGNAIDLTLKAAATTPVDPVDPTNPTDGPGPSVEHVVNQMGNSPAGPAARALDRTFAQNPNGELASHFVGLTTGQQVSDAVTQTLPLLTGGTNAATSSTLSGINRVIQARQASNSGLSSGDAPAAEQNLWIKTFGSWADQSERSGISGFDANTQGLAIGIDGAFSEQARLGVAFAYAKTDIDSDSHVAPQDAQIDTFQLIGYGSYALAPDTELNFQVDAGKNRNQGKRHMPFADATAKADYDSYSAHAGVGLGHTLRFTDTMTFVPSVRADYTWIGDESYHEKGAGALNLDVDSRDAQELVLSLDGKLNYNLGSNTVLSANLGVGYDVLNESTSISSTYAGSPTAAFTTRGVDPSPWLGRAGLGLTHTLDNGTEVSVNYDAESRSDYLNQGASVKLRWAF